MFIDIENKENSAAKMAAVAGKPTRHYLFAQELNTMVSAINSLRHLISLNEGNINALLSTAPKIELGTIVGDFVDEINAFEEIEIPSPVFITFTKDDIFYVYAFAGEANTYGTLNELYVTPEDFLPVYQSDDQGATSIFNYLKLSIQPADILTWENGTGNLYLTDKRLSVYFGNGILISITANEQNNGSLTLPRVSGMIETIRSVINVTNNRDFFDIDTSRLIVLTGTGTKTLTLPASFLTAQLEFQVILKQGTGFIASPTFTVNGANGTIELESNILYRLKRISTTEFILSPKPGSGGATVWGGLTGDIENQTDLQNALDLKANLNRVEQFIISKPVGVYGTVAGTVAETVLLSIPFSGGDFEFGDYIGLDLWTTKIGVAGPTSLVLRAGTTGTTADSVLTILQNHISGQSSASSGRVGIILQEGNFINGRTRPIASAAAIDYGSFVTASKLNLNPDNSWFLTITATHTVSTDSISVSTYKISKTKSFL